MFYQKVLGYVGTVQTGDDLRKQTQKTTKCSRQEMQNEGQTGTGNGSSGIEIEIETEIEVETEIGIEGRCRRASTE